MKDSNFKSFDNKLAGHAKVKTSLRLVLTASVCALTTLLAFLTGNEKSLSEAMKMENSVYQKAKITNLDIDSHLSYNNLVMLTLHISTPQVTLVNDPPAQNPINEYYKGEAAKYNARAIGPLLDQVISEYNNSITSGFPFRAFEAFMNYSVKLNANCRLSTYFDQYEYTGGAHGITLRTSATWDLQTGHRIKLQDLFKPNRGYQQFVLTQILLIADKQMSTEPNYFDNYRELILKTFNEESFYLTPIGVVIYYQQYDIAPYAAGIIEFEIPYAALGLQSPSCR